jgi:hypothetical protein
MDNIAIEITAEDLAKSILRSKGWILDPAAKVAMPPARDWKMEMQQMQAEARFLKEQQDLAARELAEANKKEKATAPDAFPELDAATLKAIASTLNTALSLWPRLVGNMLQLVPTSTDELYAPYQGKGSDIFENGTIAVTPMIPEGYPYNPKVGIVDILSIASRTRASGKPRLALTYTQHGLRVTLVP